MAKCKCCGAPCTRHVEPRGGDGQGWGTTDEERVYYRYDDSRNRELTRQVEQLQARVDAAEKDVARFEWYFDWTEKSPRFLDAYFRGMRERWTLDQWRKAIDAALTAPPSSAPTDDRAGTGRDET